MRAYAASMIGQAAALLLWTRGRRQRVAQRLLCVPPGAVALLLSSRLGGCRDPWFPVRVVLADDPVLHSIALFHLPSRISRRPRSRATGLALSN
jgi:hypothetical protein